MSVDAPEKNEYPRASSKKIRLNKHDHYNDEIYIESYFTFSKIRN